MTLGYLGIKNVTKKSGLCSFTSKVNVSFSLRATVPTGPDCDLQSLGPKVFSTVGSNLLWSVYLPSGALLDPALSHSASVNESCKLEPVGVLALSKSTTNAAGFYKGRVVPSSALKNPFCKCITARTWLGLNMCLAGPLLPTT